MKRCPKCSRSYQDDNQKFCTLDGGLLAPAEEGFDPNATILATSNLKTPPAPAPARPPDLSRTVASLPPQPTEALSRKTGPTGTETVFERSSPPRPSQPSATVPASRVAPGAPPKKKSKVPMILGVLLLLLVLGIGAVVAAFFLVIRPRLNEMQPDRPIVTTTNENENRSVNENVNAADAQPKTEDAYVPPPGSVRFVNSEAKLDGKLADHYFDFSFYYPNEWQTDPRAGVPGASNFAKVERRLPPDFTQENFAVGWYTSKGTFEADEPTFPQLVEILGQSLAKGFPEYRKVYEGPTKVNSLDGYEFRFVSVSKGTEKGDIQLWGRVIFLPTGVSSEQTGATLIMLATSLAPELSGVEDVGEKGQMPVILESFRFGKP
jgi:hypothetical protein